jgi:hypothetical protein
METSVQRSKRDRVSEIDVDALIECNRILKEHLDYLRTKLHKTEAVLEMFIQSTEESERIEKQQLNKIFLN